ncbi:MAG: heparinase II/III family protein [Methylobacteriaceae bacterium]|nr:heparinase II/III family protein [Methylobacteriaceae bacterium]
MSATGVAERLRLTGFLAGTALRRLRGGLVAPFPQLRTWGARTPQQLLIAPQDIRTADPTAANDIYGGHFAFAGRIVETQGQSPFKLAPPSPGWSQALMGFGWLRHLRAANTALARANARALVEDWITYAGEPGGPAWEPSVLARRLMSWLSQSPIILEGANWQFYRRFMRSLGQQTTYLERTLRAGLDGEPRLTGAIALASVGLCAEGMGGLQRRSARYLGAELRRQILPDGGHASRNPRLIGDVLLDLLPLRQAFTARGVQAPAELLNAIDRMMPMLRLFRHADGALALFNGMGVTAPGTMATLLAYDDVRAAAMNNAPYSGYQRLEAEGTILVIDAGRPPHREFSEEAHAGCLSFELSAGVERIIVNCGAPSGGRVEVRDAARATAAHSTLVVEETSSCRFATSPRLNTWFGSRILSGPEVVTCERGLDQSDLIVRASHDGYAGPFGITHERHLRLAADGSRVSGEDMLRPSSARARTPSSLNYAIRFHLHPAAQVQMLPDGLAVEIRLPGGEAWLFAAAGMAIETEESIFFAAPDGARRTRQLVVRANFGHMAHVSWSFERRSGGSQEPG